MGITYWSSGQRQNLTRTQKDGVAAGKTTYDTTIAATSVLTNSIVNLRQDNQEISKFEASINVLGQTARTFVQVDSSAFPAAIVSSTSSAYTYDQRGEL